MKLLLDENLSRRLVPFLQDAFPETTQVALLGMERADDRVIWRFARDNGYTIVTRDSDFEELATQFGKPPSVVLICTRNSSKAAVLSLLIEHRDSIIESLAEVDVACIELN
jgi:predicted nuclease of predicted toxin-antitoxin system